MKLPASCVMLSVKTFLFEPMQFEVTQIEFDFDDALDADSLTDEYKQSVVDDHIGMIVEANDEDDLIDEITSTTGWCVKSIYFITIQ